MRDKVTRQCPQTTTCEEKGELKQIRTDVPLLTNLTNTLPLGQTCSQVCVYIHVHMYMCVRACGEFVNVNAKCSACVCYRPSCCRLYRRRRGAATAPVWCQCQVQGHTGVGQPQRLHACLLSHLGHSTTGKRDAHESCHGDEYQYKSWYEGGVMGCLSDVDLFWCWQSLLVFCQCSVDSLSLFLSLSLSLPLLFLTVRHIHLKHTHI